MSTQISHETNPIVGIDVRLPDRCRCSAPLATIGSSAGPHRASLRCKVCGTHRGWVSHASYNFIAETVEAFGLPLEPIVISRGTAVTS